MFKLSKRANIEEEIKYSNGGNINLMAANKAI